MSNVEGVRVESDERGFELHLIVDEWPEDGGSGLMILNVHAVAEELYDAVKASIGPWLSEMETARAEYRAGVRPGGLTDEEREEEERCAALGMEGPNVKLWRSEQAR
jgi:hypothetical protein